MEWNGMFSNFIYSFGLSVILKGIELECIGGGSGDGIRREGGSA